MAVNLVVYILINGILSQPGDHDCWTDRGVTWIHRNTIYRAEKFEYWSRAITRRIKQAEHARALASLIEDYQGADIRLVGHSNGCDLICRALRSTPAAVNELHLISGACEADFEKNGLNAAMREERVKFIRCYTAGRDGAMGAARWSQRLLGWMGLGYGTLGLNGPKNIDTHQAERVKHWVEPTFGHSTWFAREHFDRAFRRITRVN